MKILHITPAYEEAWHLGGVVRSVSHLCRGLAALGHEVTVFTTDSGGDRRLNVPLNRPLDLAGVEVWYFKTEFSLKYSFSSALGKACRQRIRDFDLVHLASFWNYPEIPAVITARQLGVPFIVSPRGTFLSYSMSHKAMKKWAYYHLLEKRVLQGCRAIHYTTELERQGMDYLGLKPPSFVVPNGFNVGEFSQGWDKSERKQAIGLIPENTVILYLGRLHARKGLDRLLRAFAEAVGCIAQPILVLVGPDAGDEARLKSLARKLGILQEVRFPGYIPPRDRHFYLGAADVFCLTAHPGENFGNAAVEAMLAGVPVLVSEHVGICREVAADGAGVVVPLQVEAIAKALKKMLSDPEGLREMGRRAAESARRRYDNHNVCRLMATAYEDALTGRRSPGLSWSDDVQMGREH